jgi:hypothetical protein
VFFRVFRGSELVFLLLGVTPAYRRLGIPAMPGKQKSGPVFTGPLYKLRQYSLNQIW